ncbi:hypothetical protein ADK57_23925 [Streptomyces sp. MMG1533]|uniref:hypothetical protein n=1 Tax=Streptomyces sp. MMG1533 TaxID=1415546 RepID=UPI0006C2A3FF|nr:hypothetical protein [Streptomyces sp. MMG1533]KOU62838.1 hypothetical protein ADK57_23925 [Streptomyces sp. MMG1533]
MSALMLWGASSASAGGPTSVLVVSPQSTETASLYYSDEEYGELEQLLGAAATGLRDKPPEASLMATRQINVTWMAHDVSPWRLERVFPRTDADEVWIHTTTNLSESVNGYWHQAQNPGQLRALLKDLGVMGETSGEGNSGIFPAPLETGETGADAESDAGTDAGTTETAAGAAVAPTAQAEAGDGTDWWWVLPGAAAGAVLALVLRPFATRMRWDRPRGEPGPRQELRDV